jgi:hypothetical protein
MDLFAITCTTCKSRLRVRDPAAVGQILSCPKCGGMVMVKPPPAWHEASEQKSDLPTAPDVDGPRARFDETKANNSAFDILEELLSDAPPKVQSQPAGAPAASTAAASAAVGSAAVTPPPAAAKPRFVGGPPVKRSSTPPPVAAKPNATPPPTAGSIPPPVKPATAPPAGAANGKTAAPAAAEAKPAAPPTFDHSRSPSAKPPGESAPRKSWLLTAGSVAAGILLAFTAVTVAIFYLRPANVRRPIQSHSAKVVKTKTNPATTPTTTEAAPQATVAASESVAPMPTEPAADAVGSSTAPTTSAPPATVSDPLGLVKETPQVAATPKSSTDPLAKFDRILGGADDPLDKATAKPTETAPLPAIDAGPARPLAPRPPPREVDVARRLADPLPGIETAPTSTPLADFLQTMSDLSTIPITLDVPFVPVTAESLVSLRLTNTTVGNAITEAIKPFRLEHVISDDQLIVRRAEPTAHRPVTVSVKDLTGGDEQQLADLRELLKSVVEPAAWGEGEGLGSITSDAAKSSLTISHPQSVQFPIHVRLAIEKLREARTPPLAHELKLDPIFFKLDTRMALAKSRLEKPVSLNYSQPTRLLTIFERLRAATGMRILVDWRDVAAAGWNPAGEATLVVRNEPLSTALDALLTPLDLAWRVIDGQTVQVVTPARLAEQGELELYQVHDLLPGGQSSDELIARIRAALGESNFSAAGGSGEIRFDEPGKCLLAWLPQPKQRELESLLAKWRGEKAG